MFLKGYLNSSHTKMQYHHCLFIVLSKVSGLCGVYNLNQHDDLTLPSGVTTTCVSTFGRSWKTGINCEENVSTGMAVDACVLATGYQKHATEVCSVLKSGEYQISVVSNNLLKLH